MAILAATLGISLLCVAQLGCESTQKAEPQAQALPAQAELCTGCGQIKGSDDCCKPGQTACAKCGLVKGSPGCCKINKGA